MAIQIFGEDPFAGPGRFVLRHARETELAPSRFRTFDDESRGVSIELVGMRPYPAVFGFLEDEGEGVVELLPGAKPDKFVPACLDRRLEGMGEFVARP